MSDLFALNLYTRPTGEPERPSDGFFCRPTGKKLSYLSNGGFYKLINSLNRIA
jgi:hypothetical protein